MAKYRKRPVVIEATQWFKNGDHTEDDCHPITVPGKEPFQSEGKVVRYYRTPMQDGQRACAQCTKIMHDHGWIDTLEGGYIVCPGDWIITGVKGEHYPCKQDIFEATYDPHISVHDEKGGIEVTVTPELRKALENFGRSKTSSP